MTESREHPEETDRSVEHPEDQDSGAVESIRDESDPSRGQGYEGDSGPDEVGAEPPVGVDEPEGDPTVVPEPGGYAGRDPKTDMPAMPSVPETQDDTLSHDAAPDPDKPEQSGSDT